MSLTRCIGDQVWTKGCSATDGKPMAWNNNCDGGMPQAVVLPLTLIKDDGFPFLSCWGFYHALDADGKKCYVREADVVAKPVDALVPLVVEMKSPRQVVEPARFSLLELD